MFQHCDRCGAKRICKVAETRLFREFGYNIEQDFPFKNKHSPLIRLCHDCSKGTRSGGALRSRALYHPINEALKNA